MARNLIVIAGLAMLVLSVTLPFLTKMATVTFNVAVPEGNFYIDGELATETSTHVTHDPDLDIKFVATANGENVIHVRISRFGPDDFSTGTFKGFELTETLADTEWTGVVTLPEKGDYKLVGSVVYTDAGDYVHLMSIIGSWTGTEGTFSGESTDTQKQINILQIGLGILGGVLIVFGLVAPKRKRK